jgi:hypothetical protein
MLLLPSFFNRTNGAKKECLDAKAAKSGACIAYLLRGCIFPWPASPSTCSNFRFDMNFRTIIGRHPPSLNFCYRPEMLGPKSYVLKLVKTGQISVLIFELISAI